ncbi:SusC/RagA family TonB-linked outer membrane protein [Pedobacter glucosidilyticus]|uniref:SusC/RagA family TonB-linked outer membrane protein n=1 Tax=Pedobacter glucosidilyticus TaxID=1122941 RepID=UPI000402E608|nr:TonB-dependent receptor [Pedobacter glucosidilyticus]
MKFLVVLFILSIGSSAFAQSNLITVKGKVTDEVGLELPGVTVNVKNEQLSTITANDGTYTIRVSSKNAVLVFSFLGFSPLEKTVGNQSTLNVSLVPSARNLDEVIVVGYGTQKKSDLTGSVSSISVKNNDAGAYSNFQQLIGGRAPGVVVSETSGQPGSGLNIEIRGTNSLNFSSQPLYVVDGIPLDIPDVGSLSNANTLSASAASPLSAINPADIASIEVLKDASATAIYGSRGANGVVLITTKSGVEGKPKIALNFSNGFTDLLKDLELLNSQEFAQLANEAYTYRGLTSGVPFLESEIAAGLPNYNHQDEITQSAQTRDLNVSLSGGDSKSKYYLSGQYFDQEGIITSTSLKRYNFKINYDNNVSQKLKVSTSLNISNSAATGNVANSFAGGYLNSALVWAPTSPLINPDGTFNLVRTYQYGTSVFQDLAIGSIYYNPRFSPTVVASQIDPNINNPLSFLRGVTNDNTSTQILGNLGLTYSITKDLKLSGLLGVTTYSSLLENYIPTTVPRTFTLRGIASVGNLQSRKLLYQTTLTYDKKIKKHFFNSVIGATLEDFESKTQTAGTQSFTTDVTGVNAIQAGAVVQIPTTDVNDYKLVSTIFRGTYHYNYKYYLTLSARYDGSSRFAPGKQFGFFPSVGASWRVTKENWFQVDAINELKLRASYGIIGNQAVGSYNTLATLSFAGAVFGSTANTGFAPSRIPNPDLTWEQTAQANIGIDLNLFRDRIAFTADAYQRKTSDLLYQVTLPGSSGFQNLLSNVASINNRGLEFSLSSVNIKKDNFTWTTDFNISFNRNKVERLSGAQGEFLPVQSLIGSAFLSRIQPGQPIGQFFGYRTIGIWTAEDILTKPVNFQTGVREGDRRYEDINNDGLLTDADRVLIGNALPKYTGGFTSAFKYKNFDLSTFFSYSVGNDIFNQLSWNLTNLNGFNNVTRDAYNQRYIPITPDTDPARVEAIRANNRTTKIMAAGAFLDPREVTDLFVEKASFLRCRDITLTYRFNPKVIKSLKLSNLSLYTNLQNMFTITKYQGFNPEISSGSGLARGLDNGATPLGRTIRLGINVGL